MSTPSWQYPMSTVSSFALVEGGNLAPLRLSSGMYAFHRDITVPQSSLWWYPFSSSSANRSSSAADALGEASSDSCWRSAKTCDTSAEKCRCASEFGSRRSSDRSNATVSSRNAKISSSPMEPLLSPCVDSTNCALNGGRRNGASATERNAAFKTEKERGCQISRSPDRRRMLKKIPARWSLFFWSKKGSSRAQLRQLFHSAVDPSTSSARPPTRSIPDAAERLCLRLGPTNCAFDNFLLAVIRSDER